jgi:hypothetical protein
VFSVMNPQESAVSKKYRLRLSQLAGMMGRRNASLLGLATLGVMAGRGDGQIEVEVIAASGSPPLTADEVRHAIRTARRDTIPLANRPDAPRRWTPPPPKPPPLGAGAASFVARMVCKGRGATFDTLRASSPVPIPSAPAEQARSFLWALYDFDDWLFCGDKHDSGRIGRNIRTAWNWRMTFTGGSEMPPLMIANPLTGRPGLTKEGNPSHRCAACVAAYRFALVEFDAMSLEDQWALWQGVILSGVLPLRSLTFSGSKSIHGLVEIAAADAVAWDRAIDTLFYATANPDAPQDQQADRACRNPDRFTRLPGACRPETGAIQSLLWLRLRGPTP